eukprot:1755032-Amphidinium_carterae.1
MSSESWKPRLSSYGRGSSFSSGSRNNYQSWNTTGWHEGGKGSRSSGSHMPWQSSDLNSMWYEPGSSGYHMPQETFGWNAYPSMGSPTTWGTSG